MGEVQGVASDDGRDHRPDVYEEDGRWVFRASSFGSCERNLVRQAIGHEPSSAPEFMLGKYDESAALEGPILRALEEQYGWRVMRPAELPMYDFDDTGQFTLELPVTGGVIRCHPDAIAKCYRLDGVAQGGGKERPWKLGEQRVVEVKALSAKSAPFDLSKNLNYWWQFAIEMAVTKRKGIYVVGWKDEDGELIRDAQGKVRLNVGWYSDPPETLVAIKKRARRLVGLINAALAGDGLPECDVKQYPCGFYAEHEGGVWAKPALEELDVPDTVYAVIDDIAALTAEAKIVKEKLDDRKAVLLEVLRQEGKDAGEYKVGEYKVTRVQRKGQRRYDWGAMADAGYPVEDYMTIGKPSDYVTVEEISHGDE